MAEAFCASRDQGMNDGWVTDPAIWAGMTDARGKVLTGPRLASASRNAALKLCGNGVVPQQAEHAVRIILWRRAWALGLLANG